MTGDDLGQLPSSAAKAAMGNIRVQFVRENAPRRVLTNAL
jgi:hypothetical protein